jgi:PadR family transcriptional regulator PadR
VSHLGEFEQLILFSALQLGDDASGVTIRELIGERTGRRVSSGAIHTALRRLESRGLVTGRDGSPTPGRAGRPRRLYVVEPNGARALHASYSALQAVAKGAMGELAKLAKG